MIEDPSNRIADFAHYLLHGTMRFVCVGTVVAFLVGRPADAADWRQRTIEYAYDLSECDLVGLFNQVISSVYSTSAGDEPSSFECEKNLLQEFNGDVLAIGNVAALQRCLSVDQREFKQCPKAVFTFFRESHNLELVYQQ